jgi:hypothetical protein
MCRVGRREWSASWIRPIGSRLIRYGPQAQLLWKHAGKPATAAAQRLVVMSSARRTALRHADTVVEGAIVKAFLDGEPHWVVFSGGTPVAGYPTPPGELSDLVAHVDLSKKMTPDQYRALRAAASRRRRALQAADDLRSKARQRRDSW